ncbi:MAG: RHS repeat-associated core domain-containing protein [Gammaproteobacteria bacterium]|nr:RHS repeat-associated core domain-containing protein [Gammaproteobacteria bacterium]
MVAKGRRFVQLLPATLTLLPRGYNSHEHLDKLGLIHMNGRVYDPELGRFLSADPLIQFPESTQGFDRYAYVGNSPLSYTDPSGHGLLGIVGSIVSFFYPPVGALLIAVDGYMEGGLQGALFSVASMAAAAGVGDMFGPVGNFGHELARAAVHGLIQGALGAAQGGKFGAAFLAAGVTSGYGSKFGQMGNRVQRVIGAAVLGGTVSKIGGGKFANGAVTAAFVQAFGEMSSGGGSQRTGERDDIKEIAAEERKGIIDSAIAEYRDQEGPELMWPIKNRYDTYVLENARGQHVEFSTLSDALGFAHDQSSKFGIEWSGVAGKAHALGYVEISAFAAYPTGVTGYGTPIAIPSKFALFTVWHEAGHVAKIFGGGGCFNNELCADRFATQHYLGPRD